MSSKERPVFDVRLRSRRVQRELDSLGEGEYQRVAAKLSELSRDPRPENCQKLAGDEGIYRVRVGYIRIIYLIDNHNRRIEVGGIKRRSERTYRRIQDLFH